jgi:hypothetical protein
MGEEEKACPHKYTIEVLLGVPADLAKAEENCRHPCTLKKGDHPLESAGFSLRGSMEDEWTCVASVWPWVDE